MERTDVRYTSRRLLLQKSAGPKEGKQEMGIYCLVFETRGCCPHIYIGSSVADRSYYERTRRCQNPTAPGAAKSLGLGFTRTNTGMLVTFQNPEDARLNEMAHLHALNLEDHLTRVFFARTKNSSAFPYDLDMDF